MKPKQLEKCLNHQKVNKKGRSLMSERRLYEAEMNFDLRFSLQRSSEYFDIQDANASSYFETRPVQKRIKRLMKDLSGLPSDQQQKRHIQSIDQVVQRNSHIFKRQKAEHSRSLDKVTREGLLTIKKEVVRLKSISSEDSRSPYRTTVLSNKEMINKTKLDTLNSNSIKLNHCKARKRPRQTFKESQVEKRQKWQQQRREKRQKTRHASFVFFLQKKKQELINSSSANRPTK